MKLRAILCATAIGACALVAPATSPAHRNSCHTKHSCPSDHATYIWRGLLCVAPNADERNKSFKRRVRYGGRTYFCKRG